MRLWGRVLERLLSISTGEVSFERRGFRAASPAAQRCLEEVGLAFLEGYHAALAGRSPSDLGSRLDEVTREHRGFAFEGAAMALVLLDYLTPWKGGRWNAFLSGPGATHVYMVHVGAGWALARLRSRVDGFLSRCDPLLGWLVVDGYGFHEGYFRWRRSIVAQRMPRHLRGYGRRAFDQGLGRSLWFVEGGNPARIREHIHAFPESRRADLWSGIGLAATYAGGVETDVLEAINRDAGRDRPVVAQGSAFAAKARQLAGIAGEGTERACRVLCGLSAQDAARWTDEVLAGLPPSSDPLQPLYETWRRGIAAGFQSPADTA